MKLSLKVWNSPTVRAELETLAVDSKLACKVLVRSVKTRWNTVVEVLNRAVTMKSVLGELCDKAQFNKPRGIRLQRYVLTEEEWLVIEQLRLLLDVSTVHITGRIRCTDAILIRYSRFSFRHTRSRIVAALLSTR